MDGGALPVPAAAAVSAAPSPGAAGAWPPAPQRERDGPRAKTRTSSGGPACRPGLWGSQITTKPFRLRSCPGSAAHAPVPVPVLHPAEVVHVHPASSGGWGCPRRAGERSMNALPPSSDSSRSRTTQSPPQRARAQPCPRRPGAGALCPGTAAPTAAATAGGSGFCPG